MILIDSCQSLFDVLVNIFDPTFTDSTAMIAKYFTNQQIRLCDTIIFQRYKKKDKDKRQKLFILIFNDLLNELRTLSNRETLI